MADPTAVTVDLDAGDGARLARLTHELADAADRDVASRGDVLRALLVVAERNAGVRAAVRTEVRTAGVRRDPAGEVRAVAGALRDLAVPAAGPDVREDVEEQASALEGLAGLTVDDPATASERLHGVALAVERIDAGRDAEVLRAVLALAERLEVVRDAVDACAKTRCALCRRTVRAVAGGRPEPHLDRTRTLCSP